MKKYILPFIIMLFINFLGLYLGGLATNPAKNKSDELKFKLSL